MKEVSEEAGFSLLRFLNATPGLTLQNLSYVEEFLINGTLPSLVKGVRSSSTRSSILSCSGVSRS